MDALGSLLVERLQTLERPTCMAPGRLAEPSYENALSLCRAACIYRAVLCQSVAMTNSHPIWTTSSIRLNVFRSDA
jgi:hypothetical protein